MAFCNFCPYHACAKLPWRSPTISYPLYHVISTASISFGRHRPLCRPIQSRFLRALVHLLPPFARTCPSTQLSP